MKRTTLKSSPFKFTAAFSSACVAALFMGNAAFANPDNPPAETDETKVETIIVEESSKTDAVAMPNAAIEGDVELAPAEDLDAGYKVIQDQDAAETESDSQAIEIESETIVIETPETVIISNPDAAEDTAEDAGEMPEKTSAVTPASNAGATAYNCHAQPNGTTECIYNGAEGAAELKAAQICKPNSEWKDGELGGCTQKTG